MALRKYFMAIVLPDPLQGETEAIKQKLYEEHHLKGALRSPAHITLHRPFEWKEEKETGLIDTLSQFTFNKSFEIFLKDFAFFEPRVIYVDVLPNETLFELHKQLTSFSRKQLKLFNEAEDERGFHPHITVAFRDLKKPLFYQLKEKFMAEAFSGNFSYHGFSLLKLDERWEELRFFKHAE